MHRPRMRRDDSLIGQVVAANVVLVALTIGGAVLAAGIGDIEQQAWQMLVLALALILTFLVNLWMLQRRFRPLESLIERIERIDPAEPATFELETGDPAAARGPRPRRARAERGRRGRDQAACKPGDGRAAQPRAPAPALRPRRP